MDATRNIPRLSSDTDATATPATPHPGMPTPPDGVPSSEVSATPHPGMPTPPDGFPSSEVSEALYAVLNAMPDLRAALAHRLGLNVSEVDAMQHLMTEPVGPVELSRRLHMTSASASVLVDRLEEAGHVVREPDPSDGRRRVVRPTRGGAEAVYAQIGPLVGDLVEAEAALSARERRAVATYLARVLDVLQAHTDTW